MEIAGQMTMPMKIMTCMELNLTALVEKVAIGVMMPMKSMIAMVGTLNPDDAEKDTISL